jgi:hypothetical protein
MWKRVFRTALLGLMLMLPAAAPAADKPAVIINLAPYEELRRDFFYVAGLIGQDEAAVLLDLMVEARIGSNGRNGVDRSRPIGAYGWFGPLGPDVPLVLLVPVADPDAFLSLLTNLDIRAERDMDGVYSADVVNVPDPVYFRFANGYAYVAAGDRSVLDSDRLLAPGDVLAAGQGCRSLSGNPADAQSGLGGPPCRNVGPLSLIVYVDRIPADVKDQMLQAFDMQLAIAKLLDGPLFETEWQKKLRLATMDMAAKAFRTLVREGGETSVRLDLDRRAGDAALTVTVTGTPQSTMAAAIQDLGQLRSVMAGLVKKDAALSLGLNVSLPEDLRALFGAVLEESERDALAKAHDRTEREIMAMLFEALSPTLKTTELDYAFNLMGPGSDGRYALAGGIRLKDGVAVERALRDAIAKDPMPNIAWDVEREGPVSIHRITPRGNNEDARRIFGDKPIYFAIRDDALLIAQGANGLDLVREVLAVAPATGKVIDLHAAVSRLMPLARNPAAVDDAAEVARRLFGSDAGDDDRLRLTLEGGRAMTLKLEMKAKLVEFVAQLARTAR